MEAEDSSFVPFIGGGPEEGGEKVEEQTSLLNQHGAAIASLNANVELN